MSKRNYNILCLITIIIITFVGCSDILNPSTVTNVVINPRNVHVYAGNTQQFTATVRGENNPSQRVSWSIVGNNSEQTTINSNGLLSVASNETSMEIRVTATSREDTSKSSNTSVTISIMGNTYSVIDVESWNEAITGIRNAGHNRIHTINVFSFVSVSGSSANLFGSNSNIQVTIEGVEGQGNLSLSSNGSLIRVGQQQTVITRNITLQGRTQDYDRNGVVYVNGGIFIMEDGTNVRYNVGAPGVYINSGLFDMQGGLITENSYGTGFGDGGRGVFMASGQFIMSGNSEISNNRSYRTGGGGVAIEGGSFIMNDGLIMDNYSYQTGGAVFIIEGNFTMNGGMIMSNFGRIGGGGISVGSGGRFTMNDGNIHANYAISGSGGGILASRGFWERDISIMMSGGSISYNFAHESGGGVSVYGDNMHTSIRFTMNGGSITENTVNQNGGGVNLVSNATLNKTGGTISGNTASVRGNTAFRTDTSQWRNADAGQNDNTATIGFWLND